MDAIVKTRPCMVDANGYYLRCAPGPHPWRPIETAPTDGTPVLTCRAGSHFDPIIASHDDSGRWGALESDMSMFWLDTPTHWMPLPEPPPSSS